MMAAFTGGGSLDGGTLDLAPCATSVETSGGSYYEIDDSGEFVFTGSGPFGREAAMIIRRNRDEQRDEQAAVDQARRARGCRCGRTFIGSAYDVHLESGPGSRCLPGDAFGQIEQTADGVWVLVGTSGAAR